MHKKQKILLKKEEPPPNGFQPKAAALSSTNGSLDSGSYRYYWHLCRKGDCYNCYLSDLTRKSTGPLAFILYAKESEFDYVT